MAAEERQQVWNWQRQLVQVDSQVWNWNRDEFLLMRLVLWLVVTMTILGSGAGHHRQNQQADNCLCGDMHDDTSDEALDGCRTRYICQV